jgi:hypothetical protein
MKYLGFASFVFGSISMIFNILAIIEFHTGKRISEHVKNLCLVLGTCLSRIRRPK